MKKPEPGLKKGLAMSMKKAEYRIPKAGTPTYGAWKKGKESAKAGKSKEDCPYSIMSYMSTTYYRHWVRGWESVENRP